MVIRGVPTSQADAASTVVLDSIHGGQGWLFRFVIAYAASLAILILASRRHTFSRDMPLSAFEDSRALAHRTCRLDRAARGAITVPPR